MKRFIFVLLLAIGCGPAGVEEAMTSSVDPSPDEQGIAPSTTATYGDGNCGFQVLEVKLPDGTYTVIQVPVACDPNVNYRKGYPVDKGVDVVNPVINVYNASPVR